LSTPSPHSSGAAASQQFAVVSAKAIDHRKVSWEDIVAGDRPYVKPGENGQIIKSVVTLCGIDATCLSTEPLRLTCSSLKLTGYYSRKLELIVFIKLYMQQTFLLVVLQKQKKLLLKLGIVFFWLIKVLFSDETSPKFKKLRDHKDKEPIEVVYCEMMNFLTRSIGKISVVL
jgi:hypothetical protein